MCLYDFVARSRVSAGEAVLAAGMPESLQSADIWRKASPQLTQLNKHRAGDYTLQCVKKRSI